MEEEKQEYHSLEYFFLSPQMITFFMPSQDLFFLFNYNLGILISFTFWPFRYIPVCFHFYLSGYAATRIIISYIGNKYICHYNLWQLSAPEHSAHNCAGAHTQRHTQNPMLSPTHPL